MLKRPAAVLDLSSTNLHCVCDLGIERFKDIHRTSTVHVHVICQHPKTMQILKSDDTKNKIYLDLKNECMRS